VTRQVAGLVLVVLGIALALVSGLASTLGIGAGGFGWKQIVGVIVGAALALTGAGLALASARTSPRRL
jgi:hypothetical protein